MANRGTSPRARRGKHRLTADLTLGIPVAEDDALLQDSFIDNGDFSSILSPLVKERFIIGRTGTGKSALLTRLEYVIPEHVVRIAPEDLAFSYLTYEQSHRTRIPDA